MATIEQLYTAYRQELVQWCTGMTGNRETARELVQDGFVRALDNEALVTTLRDNQARAWLYRTVRNLYIDRLRHTAREDICDELPEAQLPAQTPWEYTELEMAELLQTLPSLDRKLFILRYLEGYNATQLAELYHLPPGTIRARLSQTRTLLRRALESKPRRPFPGRMR